MQAGSQPLGDAGLVAFTPCGHWWVYPVCANAGQMHELARFNLGIACSFCQVARHDATHVRVGGPVLRVN